MKKRTWMALVGSAVVVAGVSGGCDGTKAKEGVPDKVDFSKDHSPAAKPIGIDPKAGMKGTNP
jgi:hypothetical protein